MRNAPYYLILLIFIIISCQSNQSKPKSPELNADSSWTQKTYYEKSGRLKSEITVKNRRKNGPAKEYYPSGNLRSLVNYVDNITVGETVWYYENGQPYRITPYTNGKMNGIRKIYYDNGKLQAEIPYKNGNLIEGTKEYDKTGNQITNHPQIVFETKNNLKIDNTFILYCRLNKKANNAIFFQEVKNSEGESVLNTIPIKNGIPQIEFYLPSQTNKNISIPIWVEYKTQLGNPYIAKKEYQLNIDTN